MLGVIKAQNNEHQLAIEYFEKAIELNKKNAGYYNNIAISLLNLNKINDSIINFKKAIKINQNDPNTYNNLGNAYKKCKNLIFALQSYNKAINLKKNFIEALINRANVLRELKKYNEAIKDYDQSYKLKPSSRYLLGYLIYSKNSICNWGKYKENIKIIESESYERRKISHPNITLSLIDSLNIQKLSSLIWMTSNDNFNKINNNNHIKINNTKKNKIKIGYFSADFKEHAVSYLTAELFELHDRQNFEIIGFGDQEIDISSTQGSTAVKYTKRIYINI